MPMSVAGFVRSIQELLGKRKPPQFRLVKMLAKATEGILEAWFLLRKDV